MSDYEEDMQQFYSQTTIAQLMKHLPGQDSLDPDLRKFMLRIDEDPQSFTFQQLNEKRFGMCAQFKLSDCLFTLIGCIHTNSFIAIWSIHHILVEEIIESAKYIDKNIYQREHILSMSINEVQMYPENRGKSTVSPEDIAARVGLDTKVLERPCEEGLFQSFANYVHPWRLVFSDLLSPVDLNDVDLECQSEQEKRLGCLHKWKHRNGAKATVGAMVGSVLRNGSMDNAESMCQCLLPVAAITKKFETFQVPSAVVQSSASPQSPGKSAQSLEMNRSNEEMIKSYFSTLLLSIKSALRSKKQDFNNVRQFFMDFFGWSFPGTPDLDKLFSAVTLNHFWDYQHPNPLERLINHLLPGDQELESLMKVYKAHLSGFYLTTKLIDYIKYQNWSADDSDEEYDQPSPKLTTEQYRKLMVVLQLERKISDLSLDYVQKTWRSLAEEYNIPSLRAVLDRIISG